MKGSTWFVLAVVAVAVGGMVYIARKPKPHVPPYAPYIRDMRLPIVQEDNQQGNIQRTYTADPAKPGQYTLTVAGAPPMWKVPSAYFGDVRDWHQQYLDVLDRIRGKVTKTDFNYRDGR